MVRMKILLGGQLKDCILVLHVPLINVYTVNVQKEINNYRRPYDMLPCLTHMQMSPTDNST